MSRVGRGWQLSKESWAIIKRDRTLLAFPVIAGIGALLTVGVLGGIGAGLASDSEPVLIALGVVGLYIVIAISIFCGVALTACAARSLEGEDTRANEGWSVARSRLGPILGWAAVQLVVGGLITALQALLRQGAGQLVGSLIGGLANFAWTIATFFVIPTIALEGLGPRTALRRSTSIVRERWGEGVTGSFAIGAVIFLVAFLPGAALVALGILADDTLGVVLILVGVAFFLVGAVVQNALMAVFKVALYRFAVEDRVVGEYDRAQLESAFKTRRRGLRGAAV